MSEPKSRAPSSPARVRFHPRRGSRTDGIGKSRPSTANDRCSNSFAPFPSLLQRVVIPKSAAMKDPRLLFGLQSRHYFRVAHHPPETYSRILRRFRGPIVDSASKPFSMSDLPCRYLRGSSVMRVTWALSWGMSCIAHQMRKLCRGVIVAIRNNRSRKCNANMARMADFALVIAFVHLVSRAE
jgi:hypothetical protein